MGMPQQASVSGVSGIQRTAQIMTASPDCTLRFVVEGFRVCDLHGKEAHLGLIAGSAIFVEWPDVDRTRI